MKQNKRYFIYTLSDCEFCDAARDLLTDKVGDKMLNEFSLDQEDDSYLEYVKEFYNHNTVPIILENDLVSGETVLIGGYNELSGALNVNRMCVITN